MRNVLILLLVSIFLVGCQTTPNVVKEEPKEGGEMEGIESSSVELSIQSEKESYSVGEPIKLLVSLKNISKEPIIIYTFNQDAYIGMFLLEFYITTWTKDDAKRPSIPTGRPFGVIKTFPGGVMTISPNESWKATVDLRSWITDSFDNKRIVGEPWGGKILDLKKGMYEAQAIWNTSPLADTVDLKNFTQFKENPVSNTIVIKVALKEEPKKAEEMMEVELRVIFEGDMRYRIEIARKIDQVVIQTINFRNGVDPTIKGHTRMFDVNGDGFSDIVVFGGETKKGKWYKIWRFDPTTKRFVWSRTTDPGEKI